MTDDTARREMRITLAEQRHPVRVAMEWAETCTRIGELEHDISVLQAKLAHARDVEANLAAEYAAVTTESERAA